MATEEVMMKKWESMWQAEERKIYYIKCRSCGRTTSEWWGWSEQEAIELALGLGWARGLCEDCLKSETVHK